MTPSGGGDGSGGQCCVSDVISRDRSRVAAGEVGAAVAAAAPAPPVRQGAPRARRGRLLTAASLFLVTAPLLAYAGYLLLRRPALYDRSDQVLLELGVLRATHFDQLLGAYSQFGFAHPGPTWFYLMSPFYKLLGADTAAAVAAAAVVEAGFGAAVVALTARWRGGRAALATAVVLLLYLRVIVIPAVTFLWNPFAVMPATILFVLLAVAAAGGAARARWGVLIIGSFLIQTDVSTVPLVGFLALYLVVPAVRRRAVRIARLRPPSGFTLFALLIFIGEWIPPVLQQFTQSPGNLTQLADTLLGGGSTFHSPWAALSAEAQAVSVFPFGALSWGTPAVNHPTVGGLAVLLLWIAGAWALRRSGQRHADRLAASLGTLSLWTAAVSFVAACVVRGGMNTYQFYWMTGLPLVALLGWILHMSARPQAVPRLPRLTALAVAGGTGALVLAFAVAQSLIGFTSRSAQHYKAVDTPLTTADQLVDGYLAGQGPGTGGRGVLLIDQDTRDKDATVVLELVRNLYQRGWQPILPARLAAHDELRNPPAPVRCTIVIAADPDQIPAGATVLGPLRPGPHAPVAVVLAG